LAEGNHMGFKCSSTLIGLAFRKRGLEAKEELWSRDTK